MKITQKTIAQWFDERDNLRRGFESVIIQELEFQSRYNNIYSDKLELIEQDFNPLNGFFDLCYKETMSLRHDNIQLREAWLKRNKTVRELFDFLDKNEATEITIKSKDGKKIKITDITVKEISMVLHGRFKNSLAHNYDNTRIKSETARNDIVLAIKPYYDYLHTNIFTSKGGKEIAADVILKTLEVLGYKWPDSEDGREPVIVIRQMYQESRNES